MNDTQRFTLYEVVEAESPEEARKCSPWQIGDGAVCTELNVISNSDSKTYIVIPRFERGTEKEEGQ